MELVGKRLGQFNWPRSQACLSLTRVYDAIDRGFSRQFSQQQQGQQQGQRIAFSLLLASICDLFKRTIQGGRIDAQRFDCHFLPTLKYARGTLMPFLTFLGVFSDFPKYSKKWLIFGAFRVNQKAL